LLAPILRMLCYLLWPHNIVAYYVLMPCRADALLLGVLGAMAMRDPQASQWLRSHGRTLFAALLIFVIGFVLLTKFCAAHPFLLLSVGYTWLALLYLCVVLCAVTQPQSGLARVLRLRVLRWLGSIAYGVYLFHYLVVTLIFRELYQSKEMHLHNWGNLGAMAFALAVTIPICQLSWMYFEKPLLQLGHRYRYGKNPA
jgi:peptidoglycan/LPS O-acetylase OafA/YrhL